MLSCTGFWVAAAPTWANYRKESRYSLKLLRSLNPPMVSTDFYCGKGLPYIWPWSFPLEHKRTWWKLTNCTRARKLAWRVFIQSVSDIREISEDLCATPVILEEMPLVPNLRE